MNRPGVVERIVAAGLVMGESDDALWAFRALRDSATVSEKWAAWGLIWSSMLLDAEMTLADAEATAAWFERLEGHPELSRSLWDSASRAWEQAAELHARVAGCVGRGA